MINNVLLFIIYVSKKSCSNLFLIYLIQSIDLYSGQSNIYSSTEYKRSVLSRLFAISIFFKHLS